MGQRRGRKRKKVIQRPWAWGGDYQWCIHQGRGAREHWWLGGGRVSREWDTEFEVPTVIHVEFSSRRLGACEASQDIFSWAEKLGLC